MALPRTILAGFRPGRGKTAARERAPDLARLPIRLNRQALSLTEGVRAALSVAVIIAASEAFAWPPLREAALAALLTCICDPGGPIRRRAPFLIAFAILGSLVIAGFGLARGLGPAVALPLGAAGLFCASFARIYGQPQQQLGGLLSTVIVLSLDRPLPGLPDALLLAGAFVGGASWAILLTLVIWRVYPFRPARRAVAEAYRVLALLTADLRILLRLDVVGEAAWEAHARAHRRAVREAIETARGAVLDTLRARGAGSDRAAQSLIRLETADQIFGALIALSDLLEHGTPVERHAADRMLRRLRPLLVVLGRIILTDEPGAHRRIGRAIDAMEAEIGPLPADDPLCAIVARIVERLRIAHTLAVPLNYTPGVDPVGRRIPLWQRVVRPLRANLSWRSTALRHATRSTTVATAALGFTMAWFTPYDHWLTITIVATMQPYYALTYTRAIERILGTAAGGVVAALVGLVCTTPLSIAAAMFPLAIIALAVRTVSLGLFMTTLTPLVVLLVEIGQPGTSEWLIAGMRAVLTILGGIIAVAASFLLWPNREPEVLAAEVKAAIAAHGHYAETELSHLLGETSATAMDQSRRQAGLATNSLEAAITRTLVEPARANHALLDAALVIDAALRRFGGRLAAMQIDPALFAAMPQTVLRAWREWIGGAMRGLAAGKTTLPPRPDSPATDALSRLARQVELMAGAMERIGE